MNRELLKQALITSPPQQKSLSKDEIIQIGYKAGFAIDAIQNEETGEDETGFLNEEGDVYNEAFFNFVRLIEKSHGIG